MLLGGNRMLIIIIYYIAGMLKFIINIICSLTLGEA